MTDMNDLIRRAAGNSIQATPGAPPDPADTQQPGTAAGAEHAAIAGPSMNDLIRARAGHGPPPPPPAPPARSGDRAAWERAAREAAAAAVRADPVGAFHGGVPTADDYLAGSFGTRPDLGAGHGPVPEPPDPNRWLRGAVETMHQAGE